MMKSDVNPVKGIRAFPAFPVALAAIGGREVNVITVSLVHVFSFSPPLIGIGVSPSRHSHELLHRSPDFTVNLPSKDLVEETLFCGERSGREVDKVEGAGFTMVPGETVHSPTIAECIVNLECRKSSWFETGDHTWFIGEVLRSTVSDDFDRERCLMYWAGEFRAPGELIRGR